MVLTAPSSAVAQSTCWGQVDKQTPSDGAAGDTFGHGVAISGGTVVVGAVGDDAGAGSAYIFERNQGGADNWGQVKKITASDRAAGDDLGHNVAISGDTIVIGAQLDDDNGSNSGSAYIFERNQGGADNWGQVKKITASDGAADDNFGHEATISGDTIVVGAQLDDDNGNNSGSAYIFERNQGGADNWGQVKKILASDGAADDDFGHEVAISGGTVVVGADGDDAAAGSAYIFERNQGGADNWGQAKKITASDRTAGDEFGYSVAIFGDTVVVGANLDDDNGNDSGSAYIFERNQGGADNWGQVKKILALDGAAGDEVGHSTSISGGTVVVGADGDDAGAGSAYIFERNQGGADNWGQAKKILASDRAAGDHLGHDVAISGETVVGGANLDDDNGSNSGSAYTFSKNIANCFPSPPDGDFNGDGILDLVIIAPSEDLGAIVDAGLIQVLYGGSPLQTTSPADQTWWQGRNGLGGAPEADDMFGRVVVVGDFNNDGNDDLVVGAPNEDLGAIVDAGLIQVIYGGTNGLQTTSPADQIWWQGRNGLGGAPETDDKFGSVLAVGDLNNDNNDDLIIGVPEENLGAIVDAGLIQVIYGGTNGLQTTSPADQIWWQGRNGLGGAPETNDFFGEVLGVGDFNGDGNNDLAVGVEDEDLGAIVDAGLIQVIYGGTNGLQTTSPADQIWWQGRNGLGGVPETGDGVGAELVAGNFDGDAGGTDDLVLGVPLENLGAIVDAGLIQVIYGGTNGLQTTSPADQTWWQGLNGLDGSAETDDFFGLFTEIFTIFE